MKQAALTIITVLICLTASAEDRINIAVLEFQNDTGEIRRWNGWDLQSDFTRELQRTGKFKSISSDTIEDLSDEADWQDGRLPLSTEKRFVEAGVRYLLYGTVKHWKAQVVAGASRGSRLDAQRRPITATVSFQISIVDLSKGEIVDQFEVEGSSIDEVAFEDVDAKLAADAEYRETFAEASKTAFKKATSQLQDKIGLY